jgi:hypothetical protein
MFATALKIRHCVKLAGLKLCILCGGYSIFNHGADVNALGYEGWAPLHSAAYYGHF